MRWDSLPGLVWPEGEVRCSARCPGSQGGDGVPAPSGHLKTQPPHLLLLCLSHSLLLWDPQMLPSSLPVAPLPPP